MRELIVADLKSGEALELVDVVWHLGQRVVVERDNLERMFHVIHNKLGPLLHSPTICQWQE